MTKTAKTIITLLPTPLVLFALGVVFFYIHLFDNSFGSFNLLVMGDSDELISTRSGELLAGDKVLGRFQGKYPNLGIVSIRFTNENRDSRDTLVFRLKESGEDKWYYQANYNTDQFQPGKLFPFGFPILKDSSGKEYIFELESLRGATGSGIVIDRRKPAFTATSFFDKKEVLKDKNRTVNFVEQKMINVLGDTENSNIALVYFSPFLIHLIYLFSYGISFQFMALLSVLLILFDIFYLDYNSDYLSIAVLYLWFLTVRRFKFESRISALLTITLLISTTIFVFFGHDLWAEKSAIWVFLFLCVTMLQNIYELIQKPKKIFTLEKLFSSITRITIDETEKTNVLIKKGITIFVYLVSFWLLLKTFLNMKYSFGLFGEFYPNIFLPKRMILFGLGIVMITVLFSFVLYKWRSILLKNAVLFLTFSLLFHQLVGTFTSGSTTFQHSPKIFSVSPDNTSEAWVDITLRGKNLQDRPFVGKVFIDDIEQGEYVISWTDEEVVVRTSPAITKSGNICVRTFSKGNSNCLPFEYNFGKENKVK